MELLKQIKKLGLFFLFVGFAISLFSFEKTDDEYNISGDGSLSDSNIHYVGRWDMSNADYYQSHWLGAYVRVDFTGTSIKIKMEGNAKAWLIVQIDNEAPRTIYAGNGTELSTGNLKDGRHSILVGASELINNKLSFKGFALSSGAVTYKSKSKPLIEFIGDSITAGGGAYPKDIYNYAWLVSNRLDCDHTQIAYPGLALCSGYTYYDGAVRNTDQAVGMDQLYFSMKDLVHFKNDNYAITTPWNFSTYTPNIVLLFLGTNDSSNGALTPTDASLLLFKKKMGELFDKIRVQYPDAHLMCMLPFSGVYDVDISTKIDEMKNAGDDKVYFIDTKGWLSNPSDFTDGIHLNDQGTTKVVDKLYNILHPIVKGLRNESDGITIRFKKPDSWSVVNIHAWDEVGVALPGFQWPGNAMQVESDNQGWYYYTFDSLIEKVSFQFNKGDAEGLIVKEHVTQTTSYDEDGSISGLTQSMHSSFDVSVENKQIIISSDDVVSCKLYSIMGNLLHDAVAYGHLAFRAESGIYLLAVENRVYKLLVP